MRIQTLAAAALLATTPACYQLEMTAQVAYARLAIDGDLGYVSGSSTTAISQDIESAFGIGDDQDVPYGRAELDTGLQVFSVSGFLLDESGTGVLESNFGDSGILVAGTPVRSDLEMFNVKGAYAFEIPIGPVSISPGIAIDYIHLDVTVADLIGIAAEQVELNAPLPLAFVRGELDLGPFSAVAEIGYTKLDVDDVEAQVLDIEALLVVRPAAMVDLFIGYRAIDLDAQGTIDGDAFDADLQIGGFMIGGGLRF